MHYVLGEHPVTLHFVVLRLLPLLFTIVSVVIQVIYLLSFVTFARLHVTVHTIACLFVTDFGSLLLVVRCTFVLFVDLLSRSLLRADYDSIRTHPAVYTHLRVCSRTPHLSLRRCDHVGYVYVVVTFPSPAHSSLHFGGSPRLLFRLPDVPVPITIFADSTDVRARVYTIPHVYLLPYDCYVAGPRFTFVALYTIYDFPLTTTPIPRILPVVTELP